MRCGSTVLLLCNCFAIFTIILVALFLLRVLCQFLLSSCSVIDHFSILFRIEILTSNLVCVFGVRLCINIVWAMDCISINFSIASCHNIIGIYTCRFSIYVTFITVIFVIIIIFLLYKLTMSILKVKNVTRWWCIVKLGCYIVCPS